MVPPSLLNSGLITKFTFQLKDVQYKEVANFNSKFGIEIRSIRLDGKNNYETTWPDKVELFLNDNRVGDIRPLA